MPIPARGNFREMCQFLWAKNPTQSQGPLLHSIGGDALWHGVQISKLAMTSSIIKVNRVIHILVFFDLTTMHIASS